MGWLWNLRMSKVFSKVALQGEMGWSVKILLKTSKPLKQFHFRCNRLKISLLEEKSLLQKKNSKNKMLYKRKKDYKNMLIPEILLRVPFVNLIPRLPLPES